MNTSTHPANTTLDVGQLTRLIEAAQADKDLHFEALFRYVWPHVYYLSYGLCGGNEQDASDIAQQVFLNLFRKIENIKQPPAALAYIDQLTTNTARQFARDFKLHSRAISLDTPLSEDDNRRAEELVSTNPDFQPGARLEREERARLVFESVQHLPDAQREVVFLRYWGEYTNPEIAEMLHTTENTIAQRLVRARQGLQAQFQKLCGGDQELLDGRFFAASVGLSSCLHTFGESHTTAAPARGLWQQPATSMTGSGKGWSFPAHAALIGAAVVLGLAALGGGVAFASRRPAIKPVPVSAALQSAAEKVPIWQSYPATVAPDTTQEETTTTQAETSREQEQASAAAVTGSARTAATGGAGERPATGGTTSVPAVTVTRQQAAPPEITVPRPRLSYPAGGVPGTATLLAVSGATARAADGSPLTITVTGYDATKAQQVGSFLLFLHASDKTGQAAKTKTIEIEVTPR